MNKAYLVLGNGEVFEGVAFGADCDKIGELVFTTGMGGYIETLTDPSYYGQIVMHTFPMIGNYGIIEEDFEGECEIFGYVVREWCEKPSNFRCEKTVDDYLKEKGIPGIYGVDTREITRIIREHGVMNAKICREIPADLSDIKAYSVTDAVKNTTCQESYVLPADGDKKLKVALMDYGAKRNIARELQKRGCEVTVFPSWTNMDEILEKGFDGMMLSNGPGDPKENTACISELKKALGKLPIFGICLGHQLLALACGGDTAKLKYGHRGVNQPVRDLQGTRTYITSQNHGYAVLAETLSNIAVESFSNANDNTCEGVSYPELKSFSVQFHPEACSGPKDTAFLFDRFISNMGGVK